MYFIHYYARSVRNLLIFIKIKMIESGTFNQVIAVMAVNWRFFHVSDQFVRIVMKLSKIVKN